MDSASQAAVSSGSSPKVYPSASGATSLVPEAHPATRQRPTRSLPPWISSFESDHGPPDDDQMRLMHPPKRSVLPQHNYHPGELERRVSKDGYVDWANDPLLTQRGPPQNRLSIQGLLGRGRGQPGRKWDHLRTAEPVVVAANVPQSQEPAAAWRSYIQSSLYGRMEGEESEVVDPEALDKLQPHFNEPFDHPLYTNDAKPPSRRRTRNLRQRIWRMILRHSLVPLVFRLIVMVTSILSLSIATRIYLHENALNNNSAERTQSIVAIVVDSLAIPYIGYMLWDEFTGKPLGLRPATQKIALILLDLFFIIFKSASTSLAFESLVYHNNGGAEIVLELSRALASFMLVGLLAWTMNFMVNIFRTAARMGPGEG